MPAEESTVPAGLAAEVAAFLAPGAPERADIVADPYPFFARLRAQAPVHEALPGLWLASTSEACEATLRSTAFIRDVDHGVEQRLCYRLFLGSLVFLDDPDHTRIRRLVAPAFKPAVIEDRRARTSAVARDLLGPLVERGAFDFRADYAYQLPVNVICELLGIPLEDTDDWARWPYFVRTLQELRSFSDDELDEADAVAQRCGDHFQRLIDARRAHPEDDVISRILTQQELEPASVTDEELIGLLVLLHLGGHSTTAEVLTSGLHCLLTVPGLYDEMVDRPELVPSFVDEVLRFEAPVVSGLSRTATRDVTVSGRTLRRGDRVLAIISAANRDPAVCERPDDFDVHRDRRRQHAFGVGAHYCIGANLARQETEEAFRHLLAGPRLRLAVAPEDLQWTDHLLHRGLHALPVEVL